MHTGNWSLAGRGGKVLVSTSICESKQSHLLRECATTLLSCDRVMLLAHLTFGHRLSLVDTHTSIILTESNSSLFQQSNVTGGEVFRRATKQIQSCGT